MAINRFHKPNTQEYVPQEFELPWQQFALVGEKLEKDRDAADKTLDALGADLSKWKVLTNVKDVYGKSYTPVDYGIVKQQSDYLAAEQDRIRNNYSTTAEYKREVAKLASQHQKFTNQYKNILENRTQSYEDHQKQVGELKGNSALFDKLYGQGRGEDQARVYAQAAGDLNYDFSGNPIADYTDLNKAVIDLKTNLGSTEYDTERISTLAAQDPKFAASIGNDALLQIKRGGKSNRAQMMSRYNSEWDSKLSHIVENTLRSNIRQGYIDPNKRLSSMTTAEIQSEYPALYSRFVQKATKDNKNNTPDAAGIRKAINDADMNAANAFYRNEYARLEDVAYSAIDEKSSKNYDVSLFPEWMGGGKKKEDEFTHEETATQPNPVAGLYDDVHNAVKNNLGIEYQGGPSSGYTPLKTASKSPIPWISALPVEMNLLNQFKNWAEGRKQVVSGLAPNQRELFNSVYASLPDSLSEKEKLSLSYDKFNAIRDNQKYTTISYYYPSDRTQYDKERKNLLIGWNNKPIINTNTGQPATAEEKQMLFTKLNDDKTLAQDNFSMGNYGYGSPIPAMYPAGSDMRNQLINGKAVSIDGTNFVIGHSRDYALKNAFEQETNFQLARSLGPDQGGFGFGTLVQGLANRDDKTTSLNLSTDNKGDRQVKIINKDGKTVGQFSVIGIPESSAIIESFYKSLVQNPKHDALKIVEQYKKTYPEIIK